MRANDLLTPQTAVSLTIALATVLILLLPACSGKVPRGRRIPTCLTDPKRNALYCDGKAIPWEEADGYVGMRLEDFEALLEGCR